MRRALIAALAVSLAVAACGEDAPPQIQALAEPAPEYAKPLGAAVTIEPLESDPAYRQALASTFSSVTPENEMKWEFIHPNRGRFDFAAADAIVDAAEQTGRRVRGHPLVWDQQLPAWLVNGGFSADELERILREHVRTVVEHYRGRVESWDVVNEPFERDGSWTRSLWYEALGPRYVDIAFQVAREADPDARLFLNEIAAEHDSPKARALLRLARDLERRGIPIDGIGLQNHTTATGYPRRERLEELMAEYADLGLDVEITEMDVARGGPQEDVPAYRAAAGACAAAPNCTGLTTWGVTDRWTWLGPEADPLLFDEDGEPKPALEPVRSALR